MACFIALGYNLLILFNLFFAQDPAQIPAKEKAKPEISEATSIEEVKKSIKGEWDQWLQVFAAEGISVDVEKKRVEVKGAIIRDSRSLQYPIEYIIVSEGGSTHEAMILVKAQPSHLNAALLALGLKPGKTK